MRGHIRSYTLKNGAELWAAVVYAGKPLGRDGDLRDSYRWIRGFKTEKAAGIELRRILTSIDNETYVEPSKHNLAEYPERLAQCCEAQPRAEDVRTLQATRRRK